MITPNWNVAKKINAITVCRNDNLIEVAKYLPDKVSWLNQIHGKESINTDNLSLSDFSQDLLTKHVNNVLDEQYKHNLPHADACYTTKKNSACVVKTADCLPILVTNSAGDWVCAIHAGWRGLLAGIIENTINNIFNKYGSDDLCVWLGPAICSAHFIVGDDVRDNFLEANINSKKYSDNLAFSQIDACSDLLLVNKWHADIYKLAINRLSNFNLNQIVQSDICTYCHADLCHSYRRDKELAGRLATFIWLN